MGDGAFSNVYKAQDKETGQTVAVKVVRKYELSSSQVRQNSRNSFLMSQNPIGNQEPTSHRATLTCIQTSRKRHQKESRYACRTPRVPFPLMDTNQTTSEPTF
ncbi:hypothetical protein BCR37DRAFT_381191 [Protomyces lactucae-debilis]|uniref:Protein kinase domain-containing protein n=1 Tax=Protomyces lactucae-debilis TaxID=2754530 RepID=A0A1Y2FAZ0_PROLT|nr:uncharacterized protein BCR37DRAFT_381191 [Protomyces lactucae-debilis]ORY80506.1 hypothetical protein BCR37DRAFT_381191 [Protomyces lactucae-debilis]